VPVSRTQEGVAPRRRLSRARAARFLGRMLGREVRLVLLSAHNHTVYADRAIGLVAKCHTGDFGIPFRSQAAVLGHFRAVDDVLEDLDARGAPVVAPFRVEARSTFVCDGSVLTTHRWVRHARTGAATFVGMARTLHALHRELRELEPPARLLPLHAGTRRRYRALQCSLTAEWRDLLDPIVGGDLLAAIAAKAPPLQLLHGDADWRNCFATARGPLWGDWENMQQGPAEWDVASAAASILRDFGRAAAEHFLAAYDGPLVHSVLFDCIDFCVAQDAIWTNAPPARLARTMPLQRCLADAAEMRRRFHRRRTPRPARRA